MLLTYHFCLEESICSPFVSVSEGKDIVKNNRMQTF